MNAHVPSVDEDPRYFARLADMKLPADIPALWKGTPIEQFILAHNFHLPIASADHQPKLLLGTCIDFRYAPPLPRTYAYVIRCAGGRLIGSEFALTYCLSKGVRHLVLVGHNDCGMTKVDEHAPGMLEALVQQRWERSDAQDFLERHADGYRMNDEVDALEQEYHRLRGIFKELMIAPLFVSLAENQLRVPRWYLDSLVHGKEKVDTTAPKADVLQKL